MKATTKNAVIQNNEAPEIKVSVKYNQPHYLFTELPQRYRNLMEFDVALIQKHYQQKPVATASHVFLHEPYFELD